MSTHVVPPLKLYITIFLALMAGTAITVWVAFFDLGALNNVVMLSVAVTKATLVVLYFMHVRWGSKLTWVIAASGFFWLMILFTFTLADYMTRGWIPGTLR